MLPYITEPSTMSSEDQVPAVEAPAAEEAPAPKMKVKKSQVKKIQVKGQDSSSDKPKYR